MHLFIEKTSLEYCAYSWVSYFKSEALAQWSMNLGELNQDGKRGNFII